MECYLCKGKEIKQKYEDVFECRTCGLMFVWPIKFDESIYQGEASPISYYQSTIVEDRKTFAKRLDLIKKYCPNAKTLLDMGCNIGTLLRIALERGMICCGVDVNKKCWEYGAENNLPILPPETIKDKYDVVVMNDFIEHQEDPSAYLIDAKNKLNKEGVLFISTPDVGSLSRVLMGRRWIHFKPGEHIFYFNRTTLRTLLEEAGFKVLFIGNVGRYRKMSLIGQKLGIKGLSDKIVYLNAFDELGVVATPK